MAVVLTAELKRGFLSSLVRQGGDGKAIGDALADFRDYLFAGVQTGQVIQSQTVGGRSTTFQLPPIGRYFQQEELFGLSQEFLEVYQTALDTLGLCDTGILTGPSSLDATSNAAILPVMLRDIRLQDISTTINDFAGLAWPFR